MIRKKKFFCTLMLYLFGMAVIPCNFVVNAAEVATSPKDYSKNYNILYGDKYEVSTYKNYGVILSNYSIDLVKGQTYDKFISSTNVNYRLMGVAGDNAYMLTSTSKEYFTQPIIKVANLSTGTATKRSLPKLGFNYTVKSATTDSTGVLWFSIGTTTKANMNYYIMRLNPKNNTHTLYTYDSKKPGFAYDLKSDNSGNVWFKLSTSSNIIGKLSGNDSKINFNVYTADRDIPYYDGLVADGNNNVYFYDSNKVVKLSLKGNKFIKTDEYKTPVAEAKVNEVSLDKSGNLWFMNGTNNYSLFKLKNGVFNDKYKVTVGNDPKLVVIDDNNFTTTSLGRVFDGQYNEAIYTNVSSGYTKATDNSIKQ